MDTLKLSKLIGQEIIELKFHYVPEDENGLQSFHSYIKLGNNCIIDIPTSDDDDYLQLTQENMDYFKKMFDNGQPVNGKVKTHSVGQRITDFYFNYYNDEIDFDYSAFIKLSNGYYLTEQNFGPVGLTNVGLRILDEEKFIQEVGRLIEIRVEVRPFIKPKKDC